LSGRHTLADGVACVTSIDEAIVHPGNGSRRPTTSRNLRKLLKTAEGQMLCSGLGTSRKRKLQQERGVREEARGTAGQAG